jgi:hypothetical protein
MKEKKLSHWTQRRLEAYSREYNYKIIWSGKSGCTSLRQLFINLHKEELEGEELTNSWHRIDEDFPVDFKKENVKSIILCRNPYKRTASMFCGKYCSDGKQTLIDNGKRRYAINNYSCLSRQIKLGDISFQRFLEELYKIKKRGDLNNFNIHIREQSFKMDTVDLVYMAYLEDYRESLKRAYQEAGLSDLLPKIDQFLDNNYYKNETKKTKESSEFVGEKVYSVNCSEFPSYGGFYNDTLKDMVFDIYRKDFEYFKYER